MIKNKKIFITGGAGFIGSTLASRLCDDNIVVLYDNLARSSLKHTLLMEHKNVSLIQNDILSYESLRDSMKGANIVVHTAAVAGIDTVIKNQLLTMEVNILGTTNALKAARENQVNDRFIDFSTSEIFGSMAYMVNEDANAISGSAGEARWSYAVSKLAAEHLTQSYFKQYGLPATTIRPFNVYGPHQTGDSAIQNFIKRALKNEDIYIYGDGTQIRAWCYIDDMIDGLLRVMENPKAIGQSFNIGNPRAIITIHGLAETVRRLLNSKSKIVFKEALSADINLRIPQIKKASEILGFVAKVDLEEGILKTAQWHRKNIG